MQKSNIPLEQLLSLQMHLCEILWNIAWATSLTFKYINRNVLISMILQFNFLIYKTFDIYTEGSKEMLTTMILQLALTTLKLTGKCWSKSSFSSSMKPPTVSALGRWSTTMWFSEPPPPPPRPRPLPLDLERTSFSDPQVKNT